MAMTTGGYEQRQPKGGSKRVSAALRMARAELLLNSYKAAKKVIDKRFSREYSFGIPKEYMIK